MSRKDYVKIARIIKDSTHAYDYNGLDKHKLIDELCIVLKQDNSLFDKARFVEACEQVVNKYIMIE